MSATAAAKIFDAPAARSENVAIAQSSLMWRTALGRAHLARPDRHLLRGVPELGTAMAIRRASGATSGRSRRRSSCAARCPTRFDLSAAAGYRWLVFKPDRNFDFDGPTAGNQPALALRRRGGRGLGGARRRGARVPPVRRPGARRHVPARRPSLPRDRAAQRRLPDGAGRGDPDRAGAAGAGYAFHYNASNSFGETLIRHIAFARVADRAALRFLPGGARGSAVRVLSRSDPGRADRRHQSDGRRQAVRHHRGREPIQRPRRPVARHRRRRCARSFATPSTPTSWAATAAPTAATPCCCRWRLPSRSNQSGSPSPRPSPASGRGRRSGPLSRLRNVGEGTGEGPRVRGGRLYIMPPMPPMPPIPPMPPPPPPPAGAGASSLGRSTISASVVTSSAATDAAFCSAERTTFVGSMTPASTRSSNSSVAAL